MHINRLGYMSIASMFICATTAWADIIPAESAVMPIDHAIEYERSLRYYTGDCLLIFRINREKIDQDIADNKQVYIWDQATARQFTYEAFFETFDEKICVKK